MYTQTKKTRGVTSRAIAHPAIQQKSRVQMTDNRPLSATVQLLRSLSKGEMTGNQAVQRAYNEVQNANVGTMWGCRQTLGIDNASLPNNVAWSGGAIARSDLGGHSEAKAVMLNLGIQQNGNINVHTERQPCGSCEGVLRDLEQMGNHHAGINVTAHYLVPYTGNSDVDLNALKGVYRAQNYIP